MNKSRDNRSLRSLSGQIRQQGFCSLNRIDNGFDMVNLGEIVSMASMTLGRETQES